MTSQQTILKEVFGFDKFRDIQEPVILNLLKGKNSLCLMPTGGGKSIIYQVAGLMTKKTTLVISPLLALMKQQCSRLKEKNIGAFEYNSSLGDMKKQYEFLKKQFAMPELPEFIFVSPEKIFWDTYFEFLMRQNQDKIGLIVIDEAHCISQWGHTFRPTYKTIALFLQNVFKQVPPILGLTATLNPFDKQEICKDLNISEDNIFKSNELIRHNLELKVLEKCEDHDDKKEKLIEILNKHQDCKIIVYTHIKDNKKYGTQAMHDSFHEMGYNCKPFDADMNDDDKNGVLKDFESGELKIVFATSAFGMGIDIPDIRVVVHFLMPENIEQYYQEVGRAGRDGQPAFGYLLYTDSNLKIRRSLISKLNPKDINSNLNIIQPKSIKKLKKQQQTSINSIKQEISLSIKTVSTDYGIMNLFILLKDQAIIEFVCNGFNSIDCFEPIQQNELFDSMFDSDSNNTIKKIARRLNKTIKVVNEDILTLFHENEIKLVKVPNKIINYFVKKELSDELSKTLYETLNNRVNHRLENFNKLIALIQETDSVKRIDMIGAHLGVL